MRRRRLLISALGLGLLLGLLGLLTAVESAHPEGRIRTFPEALWYGLTTLTTVGYGDLCPVTPMGRLIGALLQLASLGLLVFFISALTEAMRGTLLPLLRLRLKRGRTWYVFTHADPGSLALGRALRREDPDRVVLFANGDRVPPSAGLAMARSAGELLDLRKGRGSAWLISLSGAEAADEALYHAPRPDCRVCRRRSLDGEPFRSGEIGFDPNAAAARLYWQRFPLLHSRERILLIGSGRCAEALLTQALTQNVLAPEQQVHYWVFGDFSDYQRCHRQLLTHFSERSDGFQDTLTFSEAPWNADADLLGAVDRLLFCDDAEEATLRRLSQLRAWFPVTGQVHARLSAPLEGVECFGGVDELYTPELVLRERLDALARRLHERYRADHGGPEWAELSGFLRRSNLASADHLAVKARILLGDTGPLTPERARLAHAAYRAADAQRRDECRRVEHERWMRFHLLHNWRLAPQRDDARRLHTMLLPFDALTPEQQARDDAPWELLGDLPLESAQ